jgi:hypothetical protein
MSFKTGGGAERSIGAGGQGAFKSLVKSNTKAWQTIGQGLATSIFGR